MNLLIPPRTTTISVPNVEAALYEGLTALKDNHFLEESRNGGVAVFPGPVVTEYLYPWQRVVFNDARNANPFFHFMEALWMLAGRNDVVFLSQFNKRIAAYSNDGATFDGAYGERWRNWNDWGDQLVEIVEVLRRDSTSQRAVLAMHDPATDLGYHGKDQPCNTHVYFDLRYRKLNMTVCCRSNDMLWGAYGANAVHFSMLQQFLAEWLGVGVGVYTQVSNNMHVYLDKYSWEKQEKIRDSAKACFFSTGKHAFYSEKSMLYSLGGKDGAAALRKIEQWCQQSVDSIGALPSQNRIIKNSGMRLLDEVALPMYLAWRYRKVSKDVALGWCDRIEAPDWSLACRKYILRNYGG